MTETVFTIRELTYATPTGRVLQEKLTFTLQTGQMLLITGSNGCGKSTLLKTLLRQFPIVNGTVHCTIAPSKIAYIPQLENTEIHLPLTLRDVLNISRAQSPTWDEIAAIGLLRKEHLDTGWNTASGGERKRTLLTRALLRNPSVLVFDEPMNHLDAESRKTMIAVMARFLNEAATARAILMVSHQGLGEDEHRLFDLLHLNLDAKLSRGTP